MSFFMIRKIFFQVVLPGCLALMSILDYGKQSTNRSSSFGHLYIYTAILLIIYSFLLKMLECVFGLISFEVLFKKTHHSYRHHQIVSIRRIYDFRYSDSKFVSFLSKMAFVLGMDGPIFIPKQIIEKISATEESYQDEIIEGILSPTEIYLGRLDGNESDTSYFSLEDPEMISLRNSMISQ